MQLASWVRTLSYCGVFLGVLLSGTDAGALGLSTRKQEANRPGKDRLAEPKKGNVDVAEEAEEEPKKKRRLDASLERVVAGILKSQPEIVALRKEIKNLQADVRILKELEGTQDGRKAERDVPKLEKKIARYAKKLEGLVGKLVQPLEREMEKLRAEEGKLSDKISSREEKGRSADKFHREMDILQPKLRKVGDSIDALEFLADVAEDDDEGDGKDDDKGDEKE